MSRVLGYLVMESCENYEQALCLDKAPDWPSGGLLQWANPNICPRTLFPDRKSARAAIKRTEHYRLAFGLTDFPESRYCNVVPVKAAAL